MKHKHSVVFGTLAAAAAAVIVLAVGGQGSLAVGDIIYVDAAADGENDGSTWADAFTDLQLALDAAENGFQIWVAEGTYKPSVPNGGPGDRYNSFQLRNGVALYGGFAGGEGNLAERDWVAHETILSGDIGTEGDPSDNSYHVFFHPPGLGLNYSAVLDGFIITGGNANGGAAHQSGGGIYNYGSSPAITNCTFVGNTAKIGGGIYNFACSTALIDCRFEGNSALQNGGGMGNSSASPLLMGCSFSGNIAVQNGGGIYEVNSSSTLSGCSFEANSAAQGGGIHNAGSAPTLDSCTFAGNSAQQDGGGMFNNGSSPELTNCTFSGNTAAQNGGGIYNLYSTLPTLDSCTFAGNNAQSGGGAMHNYTSSPVLTNCIFAGNSAGWGGAMGNYNSPSSLTNCTFWGNSADRGGGLYNRSSSPSLTNSILWGDTPDEIFNYDDETGTPVVTYSDVEGGYAGVGNIDAVPWFVDADGDDFHLKACSPCIDSGDDSALDLPAFDFEGDARILDGDGDTTVTVDMGVDEVAVAGVCYHTRLPLVFKGY